MCQNIRPFSFRLPQGVVTNGVHMFVNTYLAKESNEIWTVVISAKLGVLSGLVLAPAQYQALCVSFSLTL